MVFPDSHGISRVPWYLGTWSREGISFCLPDCHRLWWVFPYPSAKTYLCNSPLNLHIQPTKPCNTECTTHASLTYIRFRLFPFRSPLLGESLLISFPQGTEMFQFPRLSSITYEFSDRCYKFTCNRFADSGIHGSTPVGGSPRLFAACYALHRLLAPRHPP